MIFICERFTFLCIYSFPLPPCSSVLQIKNALLLFSLNLQPIILTDDKLSVNISLILLSSTIYFNRLIFLNITSSHHYRYLFFQSFFLVSLFVQSNFFGVYIFHVVFTTSRFMFYPINFSPKKVFASLT